MQIGIKAALSTPIARVSRCTSYHRTATARPHRQAELCAWPEPACSLLLREPSHRCRRWPHARLVFTPRRKRTWAPLCATSHRGSYSSSSVRRRVAIIFRVNLDAIELSLSPPVDPTQSRRCASRTTRSASRTRATRPARTSCRRGRRHRSSYVVCVDGATSRRFFQWLYEHGIDVAA